MFKRTQVSTAAIVALGATLLMGSGVGFAQTTERIEITGTRIKSLGVDSISPISSVTDEEIRSSQPVAVEEVIRGLPAAVPAIGPGTNNGSGGGATIDLRGLGVNRTLVLVNGRRLVPFDLTGRVDTNSIPIALLERIDLVTGGASTVYGADAVSGVANFVLRKNFSGAQISTSFGESGEGDTRRTRTDATIGANLADGRGNVVLSLGSTKSNPLRQGERSFGASSLSSTTGNPQGSGTGVPATFSIGTANGGTNLLSGNRQINPTTGTLDPVYNSYNFNPLNYFQTPLDRVQATALGRFVINNHAEVYAELMYTRSDVSQNLAPSGTFGNSFDVPIGNPYIPEPARQQICAQRGIAAADCVVGNPTLVPTTILRRLTELGPRLGDFGNKTLQTTLGVKGDFIGTWGYDAYMSKGEADQIRSLGNWGSLSKVRQALNAVSTTSCVNTANGCVPLNIWGADGSITPAMLNFINLSSLQRQTVTQDVMAVTFSGDLGEKFKLPTSRDPIGMAVGIEHRKVTGSNFSDASSQIQGEVLGTGAPLPDRSGTLTLKEVFFETLIPIASKRPGIEALNLEAGYRHSEFSTTNTVDYGSWKFGGMYSPMKGLKFRAMQQRATRAPNVNELFAPQTSGLSNLAIDPCQLALIDPGQANTAGTLSNLCRLTGVPVSQIGSLPAPSAGQINQLGGGNPALGPEVADTTTVGFVFEPAFVPGLQVMVDYYRIDIDKAISNPSTTDVLNGCYSTAFNPSLGFNASCALVHRNPTNGTFNGADARGVETATSNLGKQFTSGIDLGVTYGAKLSQFGLPAKYGRVDASFNINVVEKYTFQATPASVNRDCLGYYSVACGAPNYKQKFSQRTTWNMGDWSVGYNWRHLAAVIEEPGGTNFLPAYASIGAYDYVDLSASWNVQKNLRLNLSVTNLFDKQPPIVGNTIGTTSTNSGNTFPQNYDVVGRYFTIGANLTF